jgi:hypothetical protein
MYGVNNNGMMHMAHMQMMSGGMGMGLMNTNNPRYFYFVGTPQSLQARLDTLSDAEINQMIDANITVTGIEIQPMNMMSYMCTLIWGSIILIPIFFMCMPWWKRCTYPIYEVP